MKELIEKYANKYINELTYTKEGYCKRCLKEKWRDATTKKTLYEYRYLKDVIFICYQHVGCMEVGKELAISRKPMNDLEKKKSDKELDALIKEGEDLLK